MKRIRQKHKTKFNKYLQRHLANEYKKIILYIRLLETKMQELRLEEKSVHQNKLHLALLSTIEPNCFEEANKDEFWNKAMNE
jgi:hypothetical protein